MSPLGVRFAVLVAWVGIASEVFAEGPVSAEALQSLRSSIEDRSVDRSGFGSFKAATSLPATSPSLADATENDLVIRSNELVDPQEMVLVVRKPRSNGIVYRIPEPPELGRVYDFLKDHLENARKIRASVVEFAPGAKYIIVPKAIDGRHVKFEGFRDTVFDLNGSTLQLTQVSLGLLFSNCQRVVVKNGTVRGVGCLATIAKVVADDSPAGIRFEILPEYLAQLRGSNGDRPMLITVGAAEKSGTGWQLNVEKYKELFVNRGSRTNNFEFDANTGSFVSTSPMDRTAPFAPAGDHVWLLHYNNHGMALLFDNEDGRGNADITLDSMNFVNIPGMVVTGEIVSGLHLNRVSIATDATVPGAFLGAASDGIHINANGGDVVIENCFLGQNADDKITIKGNYWKVTDIDEQTQTLTVEPVQRKTSLNRWGWAGQKVVFIKPDFSIVGQSTLKTDSLRDNSKKHLIQVSELPAGVGIGAMVGNVDNSGGRIVIRNNRFLETRAQGILVQSSHMLITGNEFEGIAGPAIKLNVSLNDWYESLNVNNIFIGKNRFHRCSMSERKPKEIISFNERDGHGNEVSVIDNVRIEGNTLR